MAKQYGVRCSDSLQQKIEQVVLSRNLPIAHLFREAIRNYLNQDEIKNQLLDFEKRQIGNFRKLMRQTEKLNVAMDALMHLTDLFLKSYLLHTPPVTENLLVQAKAQAKIRYEKIMHTLAQANPAPSIAEEDE